MKIGLFSDTHYCREEVADPGRLGHLSFEKVKTAMEDFTANQVDLIMCLGDLVDVGGNLENSKKCLKDIVEMICSYSIPFLFVAGNHDFSVASMEAMKELISVPIPPMIYEMQEYRIICIDANYESDMKHYGPEGYDWTDTNVPPQQLEYLQQALDSTEKECIVAIHEPIDRNISETMNGGAFYAANNAAEVRHIIEKSGKVKLVLQGHMHEYFDVTENGIRYLTVVGMCEGTANRYMILDWTEKDSKLLIKEKD